MRLARLAPLLLLAAGFGCAHPAPAGAPVPEHGTNGAAPSDGAGVDTVRPTMDPGRIPTDLSGPRASDSIPQPLAPPREASRRGWMPRAASRVDAFAAAHPTYDGRGVLLGILDSGIDPTVPGLAVGATGTPRIVDLRDFSGEGTVPLARVTPRGDSIEVNGVTLAGAGRVRALAVSEAWYAGMLRERPLGEMPAADLNGDGDPDDRFLMVVVKLSDGWALLVDTNGDGTLQDERPMRDYAIGRDVFTFTRRGALGPTGIAVNLTDPSTSDGVPALALYFDTSGHGTHVAGIAAGAALYGVAGFDGIAPGVDLLGLKISNNAHGGITTTGSMLAAIRYAVATAAARRQPLVLNMSFGVGNEAEGAAAIDQVIDSVLAEHPEVVFAVSAGNDGPGLSTLGFPGSAERIISVGATYPGVFLPPARDGTERPAPIAFFSARGGELARPHLVTPGMAYSSVPRWNTGEEEKSGTSMASPYAAGLAARLVSALHQEGKPIQAVAIRQALMASAEPVPGGTVLDEGAGVPDLPRAFAWLMEDHVVEPITVRAVGHGVDAAYRPNGFAGPADTVQAFVVRRSGGPPAQGTLQVTLDADVPWLRVPAAVALDRKDTIAVRYDPSLVTVPGIHTGVITGWGPDRAAGPLFRLINTVMMPAPSSTPVRVNAALPPGQLLRIPIHADAGRPFAVTVGTRNRDQRVLAFLHEPGGMPYRVEPGVPGGFGEDAARFEVDARDVQAGTYEVVAVAAPGSASSAVIAVDHSPVRLEATRKDDGTTIEAIWTPVTADTLQATLALGLVGAERLVEASGIDGAAWRWPVQIPAWASGLTVEVAFDPARWPEFTDVGLSLEDSVGTVLQAEPINYAVGRLTFATARAAGGRDVALVISPGFARSAAAWRAAVSIRFYAESPVLLDRSDEGPVAFTPGEAVLRSVHLPPLPWALGAGFVPLIQMIAATPQHVWSREVPLSRSTPSVPQ